MEKIKQAVHDFMDNEDTEDGEQGLRNSVNTLAELRFAIAFAMQEYNDEWKDVRETLISL